MIVAGFQTDIVWESPDANFAAVSEMAARAMRTGPRLLVLPEMFATGFTMEAAAAASHAERTVDFLAGLARQHGVWVCGGFVEPARGEPAGARPRNACALLDPQGQEQGRYHKIHPFTLAGEHAHYDGGTGLHTIDVEGVRVTPLICYDLRFPEPFRAAAAVTDLFLVIANWPSKRRDAWSTLLRARAIENQCFVLGVNRVGVGGGEPHAGDSALIDPMGATRANSPHTPSIVHGAVDAAEVAQVRARFSFLADRRPDVYAQLDGGSASP